MRIAKHPSIWDRSFHTNIEKQTKVIDNQPTLINMVKRTHKKMAQNRPSMEIDDSSEDDSSMNPDNLLNAYQILPNDPPAKRFRENERNEAECSTTTSTSKSLESDSPKRNPFKIKADASPQLRDLLSPTRITKENASFIRNQSPVKRIEYPRSSPAKHIDGRKLEKLSKFQRTVIPADQNTITISRFFSKSDAAKLGSKPIAASIQPSEYIDLMSKTDNRSATVTLNAKVKTEPESMDSISVDDVYLAMSAAIDRSNSFGLERERTPDRDNVSMSGGGSTGTTANSQQLLDNDIDDGVSRLDNNTDSDSMSCSLIEIVPERTLIIIDDDDDDNDEAGDEYLSVRDRKKAAKHAANDITSPSMVSKHLKVFVF